MLVCDWAVLLLALSALAGPLAHPPPGMPDSPPAAAREGLRPALLPHPAGRYWLSGQINLVLQAHPDVRSPYAGPRSFTPAAEARASRVLTLYTGYRLTDAVAVVADVEMSGGEGVGGAGGLGGYTNLDVVRTPSLGGTPYLARLLLHCTWPLSTEVENQDRGPLALAPQVAARRLEVRVGKFSLPDFFDQNAVGGDSHLQFLNWAVDNDPAWDYAADTRGYTVAALAEYHDHAWAVRFAEALMPTMANGIDLEWNLGRAHAENLEVERRFGRTGHRMALRALAFSNHANMGNYRAAIDAFRAGQGPKPDITAHPRETRTKYGGGLNFELGIADGIRAYGRAGWNDGHNESFAYTEADRAVSAGADVSGARWKRPLDKVGAAVSVQGLSPEHAGYLALGGVGFMLGDGTLRYRHERVFETYYTAQVWHGLFLAADFQFIAAPGYNADRGPIVVAGFRVHLEL